MLSDNSASLKSAIANIDSFAGALARNSDKVDGILAGLERMTGGGTSSGEIPVYEDRKSVVEGKSVKISLDVGGRRIINKKKKKKTIILL